MAHSLFIADNLAYELSTGLTKDELFSFPAYKTWIAALTKTLNAQASRSHPFYQNPYKLHGITVQAIDRFKGGRLGFLKLKADIHTDDNQSIPSSVFMRGGSVAMLLVLKGVEESSEEYVILTKQPRVPVGSFSFVEIPAGMIDDCGSFAGAAAKEIEEETGLTVKEDELVNMTELASQAAAGNGEEDELDVLQNAIYPSPGGSDEFIPLFLVRKTMQKHEIDELQGKLTGLRDHGEKISLKIVKLRDVWKVAGRDAKTLSALCLYDNLQRDGQL